MQKRIGYGHLHKYHSVANLVQKAVSLEQDQAKKALAEWESLPRKIGMLFKACLTT
jgi:hypothetical protein